MDQHGVAVTAQAAKAGMTTSPSPADRPSHVHLMSMKRTTMSKKHKEDQAEGASKPEAPYRPKRFHLAGPGGSLQVSRSLVTSPRQVHTDKEEKNVSHAINVKVASISSKSCRDLSAKWHLRRAPHN